MESKGFVGRYFGNYVALASLGEGAMGCVFLAEHRGIGRKAAIKVLRPEVSGNPAAVERFFAEARAATAIRHAGIVDVLDAGILDDGVAYVTMEVLEGETLGARLRRVGRLRVADAVSIGCQIASALAAAHVRGIVHRDVKPDNVMLVPGPGEGETVVKVLDFGVAKLRGSVQTEMTRTRSGAVIGTPLYMSPEQCLGDVEIDHRSDIYSLGIILHEMLAGTPPFSSAGLGQLFDQHLHMAPPDVRELNRDVSSELAGVLSRALAKEPRARFASIVELRTALEATLGGSDAGRDAGGATVGTAPRSTSRRRVLLAAALTTLGASGLFLSIRSRGVPPAGAVAANGLAPSVLAPRPPQASSTVEIEVTCDPRGADITDADHHLLGRCPVKLTFARRDTPLELMVARSGWQARHVTVPLRRDGLVSVALIPEDAGPRPLARAGRRTQPAIPAVTPAALPAAATVPSPEPTPAPAPVRSPRKI